MEPTRTAMEERRLGRSVLAVIAGMLAGAFLSLGTDELLHLLKVYPPWNEPMRAAGLNALALGYRIVYDTLGSYVTARLRAGRCVMRSSGERSGWCRPSAASSPPHRLTLVRSGIRLRWRSA